MNLFVENLKSQFVSFPKDSATILSKDTPYYDDTRRTLAIEIAKTQNIASMRKCASILCKTIDRLCYSGASQTYALESMVECGNALLALGKVAVPPILQVLENHKTRGIYLYSQRAMLMCLEVLESLHDIRAIPNLKHFLENSGGGDMFVKDKARNTLKYLEALESSGLGRFM